MPRILRDVLHENSHSEDDFVDRANLTGTDPCPAAEESNDRTVQQLKQPMLGCDSDPVSGSEEFSVSGKKQLPLKHPGNLAAH